MKISLLLGGGGGLEELRCENFSAGGMEELRCENFSAAGGGGAGRIKV